MSVFNDFLANLGFGTSSSTKAAQDQLQRSNEAYKELTLPTLTPEQAHYAQAYSAGPTAMNDIEINPQDIATQEAQMAALANLAANGGKNASSTANLAQIEQGENANAKGARDAIIANANARGMGNSGAELLAELGASQNATTNQNARDLGVLGQEANTALQAGQGAANIGSNLQNNSFNQQAAKAQAQDAINRFNAGQNTGISQYNAGIGNQAQQYNTGLQQTGYQNQFQKAAGISGSDLAGVNFNQAQANMGAQQAGNILGAGVKIGTAAMGAKNSGGNAARGGEIPGQSLVSGDSTLNDFMKAKNAGGPNINVSPHEVVVPVSLRQNGTKNQIANFVRHPPSISSNNKEAMLSALKNIRKRAG